MPPILVIGNKAYSSWIKDAAAEPWDIPVFDE